MSRAVSADFVSRIAGVVGGENCREQGTAIAGAVPLYTVAPANAEEMTSLLRVCSEHKLAVTALGSGLHQYLGMPPQPPFIALTLTRLRQVEHYDPGDLTIGVGAGMSLRELDTLIAPHRQWLPLLSVPQRSQLGHGSIGGALATALHGPLKHAFGGVREFCIGVHFATGDGKRAKGGGRVVKNVAGYDLMKLLISSYGTLGVITSASFKLFPRPRNTVTFVCQFETSGLAIEFRDRVQASPLSPLTLEMVSPGAARLLRYREDAAEHWQILLRASGSDRQFARYRQELGSAVSNELSGPDEIDLWCAVDDFEFNLPAHALVLSISCPIADTEKLFAALDRSAAERGLQCACIGRAGVGSFLLGVWADDRSAEGLAGALHGIRAALPPSVITTVRRSPEQLKSSLPLWQIRSGELELMRTLKNALDPAWILNRGRYFV
jgi:FAD/FMN-containing dehydrogenase